MCLESCAVLQCSNTSLDTNKLFIRVPTANKQRRNIWLELADHNLKELPLKTKLYICEDHFDLQRDMENYMEYKIMGSVKRIRMKQNCVPSKLKYQTDENLTASGSNSWSAAINRISTYDDENKNIKRNRKKPPRRGEIKMKKNSDSVRHRKEELDACQDYEIIRESSDFEEDACLNVFKKEEEIINNAIENLYKDHVVEEDLVIGPEVIQEEVNQDLYKNIETADRATKVFDNGHTIKKEVLESEITKDEDIASKSLKKEKVIDEDTKEYIENIDVKVKVEPCDLKDVDLFIKFEKETVFDEDSIDNLENSEKTEDLYENHIVKDEIVLGPEIIQEILDSPNCNKDTTCDSPLVNNKNTQNGLYICDYCQKSFQTRGSIQQHLRQHETKSKCHVCGKNFSYLTNLRRHLTLHSGLKPHRCTQCHKTFARKDYLKFHIYSHHDNTKLQKSFLRTRSVCELCNKEFSSKCSRDHHKKYSCPMNLYKQKLSKNKLYICDVCNKSYKYRSSLSAHIVKSHTNIHIRPIHECDVCGKKYVKKHNLQCHMQSKHLNVSPYKCKICKETFTWHSTLALHQRKVHGRV